MIPDAAIGNLAIYSLQIAVIVAVASVLPWLLRLDNAGARYAYWRAIGLLCLALPWIQPYQRLHAASAAARGTVIDTAVVSTVSAGAQARVDWALIALTVIAVGVLLRLAWLGLGLFRLRQLRLSASSGPRVMLSICRARWERAPKSATHRLSISLSRSDCAGQSSCFRTGCASSLPTSAAPSSATSWST